MATYGQIRFRLSKLVPGVDPDLIDGWIEDRYTQILDRVKWQRLEVRAAIQTAAPYATGTMTLVNGSVNVIGVGTAWIELFSGMGLRVTGDEPFYAFRWISALLGSLDRPYEGASGTYTYKLYQSVYPLPADCKIINGVFDEGGLPLAFSNRVEAAKYSVTYGIPAAWRWMMDDTSDPPRLQIELYPIPDSIRTFLLEYVAEDGEFGRSTSSTLLPWVSPGCLVAGVESDMLTHVEKFAASDRLEKRFNVLLADMVRTNNENIRPKRIRMSSRMGLRSATNLSSDHRNQFPE